MSDDEGEFPMKRKDKDYTLIIGIVIGITVIGI